MKRLISKMISAMLGAAVMVSLAAGCSGGNEKTAENQFSYWMELPGSAAAVVTNYGETKFAKELQNRTGVTISYQHPPQGQTNEKFNIMMASDNLPDIIEYAWANYPGGPAKAIEEGKIIRLNEYIDKYAPELAEYLKNNEEIAKLCMTDEGDIFAFPFIRGDVSLGVNQGLIVRKDWLDELGLEEPETMDDWENMLTEFKTKKNAPYPLEINPWAFQCGAFAGAYGTIWDYYVEDGQVKYGPYDPEFKEFVTKMNDWYNKGLLTPDFASLVDSERDADFLSGKSGAVFAALGSGLGTWLNAKQGEDFELAAVKYPVLNEGELPKFNSAQLQVTGDFCAITTSCKDPDGAAKFLSYGYTDEGHMLFNFGIEGESYEMIDGYPTYTDNITNNSEGYSMSNMLAQYCQSYWQGPFIQDKRYYEQYAGMPEQQQGWANISVYDGVNRKVPYLYYSSEESSEMTKKQTSIETYVQEQICKFIVNLDTLDNYDAYIQKLQDFGIDEVLQSMQEAYERYLQR